jgi:hypothetical protein
MGVLSRFLERRNWRRRARAFLRVLQREPAEADVKWLADLEPQKDLDHARWELRYARLALGQISAERDALDDRVAAVVARELLSSFARDPRVAAGMLPTVEQQLNARLRRYREAVSRRSSADPLRVRLGRELLTFTRGELGRDAMFAERAGTILDSYVKEANLALQASFGRAVLPENIKPSEVTAA